MIKCKCVFVISKYLYDKIEDNTAICAMFIKNYRD